MRTLFHPTREDIVLEQVLYALSDPLRMKIVTTLADQEEPISCGECELGQDIPKSTQSHHFKVLREAGVTCATPDRTRLLISLRRADLDARFPGLLDAVLRAHKVAR